MNIFFALNKFKEPSGSWKKSCESYVFDDNDKLLTCMLISKDGFLKRSNIICTIGMELENDNGDFKVIKKGFYPDLPNQTFSKIRPAGNWSETALNIKFDDSILTADLQKKDGSYMRSSIVVLDGMILENDDGRFKILKNNFYNREQNYVTIELPSGSWILTASNIKLKKKINTNIVNLSAYLKNCENLEIYSEINFSSEKIPRLSNENGKFKIDN